MSSISPYFSYEALTWWQPTDRATRFCVEKKYFGTDKVD